MRRYITFTVALSCFSLVLGFPLLADPAPSQPDPTSYTPTVPAISPGNNAVPGLDPRIQAGIQTVKDLSSSPDGSDPTKAAQTTYALMYSVRQSKESSEPREVKNFEPDSTGNIFPSGKEKPPEPSGAPQNKDLGNLSRPSAEGKEKRNQELEDLLEFMKREHALSKEDESREGKADKIKDRFEAEFERKLQEKINALMIEFGDKKEGEQLDSSDVVVLDAVNFTNRLRAIHRLLNPPARLHPWLRWLLYLNRVTPEMIEFYQAALEGRDRIFVLASESNGKLKIRYNGRVMDVPVFAWPDDAQGSYELVMIRQGQTPVPHESSNAVPVASTNPTP